MRLGAHPAKLEPGSRAPRVLRADDDFRTPSTPLRVQQHLPAAVRRARHGVLGIEPRWIAGGNHGIAQSSLVCRRPVSPGIQIQTDRGSPVVRRIRRSRRPATCHPHRNVLKKSRRLSHERIRIRKTQDHRGRRLEKPGPGRARRGGQATRRSRAEIHGQRPRISRFPKRRSPCS